MFARLEILLEGQLSERDLTPTNLKAVATQLIGDTVPKPPEPEETPMRIKSIELAWFRGAAGPVSLEPNCNSMVVYGENGSGKSSFVDAVEYVLNGGGIEHLKTEYSGSLPSESNSQHAQTRGEQDCVEVRVQRRL